MTQLSDILSTLDTIAFFLSTIACIYMFYCYRKLPYKNFGAQMIITLTVADFIFHFSYILFIQKYIPIIKPFANFITSSAFRFSMFWSSSIALILYKLLSRYENATKMSKYYKCCLFTVISLSLILSLISLYCNELTKPEDQTKKQLISGVSDSSFVISLLLTLIYYVKSIKILKRDDCLKTAASRQFIRTLYQYALVQFITIGPQLIYSYYTLFTNKSYPEIGKATVVLFGLTGFANCMVYFFKRDGFGESTESSLEQHENSEGDSYYEDHDTTIQLQIQAYAS